ncbi:MAG: hypothetical protein ABJG15_04000 [Hyphomonadaceae bacterium]
MKIIYTIALSTSLLGLTGCAAAIATASQQIKEAEKAATFRANAAKPITAAERAAFPVETGLSGAFRHPNDKPALPYFLTIEPDSANSAIVWKGNGNPWNSDIVYGNYAGTVRPNAVDFNYNGYRATITYNSRRDSISLSTRGRTTEYVRASYEDFYIHRNGLGY